MIKQAEYKKDQLFKAEILVKEADRKDREVEKCQSYLNR